MARLNPSFLAILLTLSSCPPLRADDTFPVRGVGRPFFIADAIAVPDSPDSIQVEVLWEVPFRELAFRKDDEYYRARYDVAVVFTQRGRQIGGDVWERRVRAESFADTRDYDNRSKGRTTVMLPTGKYEVRLTVTDRTARSSSLAEGKLEADFRSSRIGLSDLRFLRYTEDGAVPNPGREVAVGETGHTVRITLHPDSEIGGPCEVKWRFENAYQEEIDTRDTTLTLAGDDVTIEIPLPTDRFAPGLHRLDVRLTAEGKDAKARRKTEFYVRLTPEWFVLHRQEAIDVFKVIGTEPDVRLLTRSKEEDWPTAVEQFWRRRDPTPGTDANEYRDSIQTRMETAASNFHEPFRQGWQTDRGRILLQHGQPARRTVNEGTFDTPSTEIWEYESPTRVFVFVDSRGNGEYWLRG